jgi:peptidoglycan/LPS O-acetylase OafA/YrhL
MVEQTDPQNVSMRFHELDYLRGFAIVAVLLNHVSTLYLTEESQSVIVVNLTLKTLSGLGVLTFFFISGMVLSHRYYPSVPLAGFYKKRLRTIIPPYLTVSTIFIVYWSIVSTAPSVSTIIFYYLTGSTITALWFIVVILQFYLLYPFFIALYAYIERRGLDLWFVIVCLIIQLTWNIVSVYILYGSNELVILLDRVFLSYLWFFVLGVYVARNYRRFQSFVKTVSWAPLIGALIATFVLAAATLYACTLTPILGVLSVFNFYMVVSMAWPALFLTCYKISLSISQQLGFWPNGIMKLGLASFGIYLLNPFVIMAINRVLGSVNIDMSDLIYYPIAIIGLTLITYLLVRFLSKLPHSVWFVGR